LNDKKGGGRIYHEGGESFSSARMVSASSQYITGGGCRIGKIQTKIVVGISLRIIQKGLDFGGKIKGDGGGKVKVVPYRI